MFAPQGITLIRLFPEGTRLFGTFGPSGQRIHLGLRAKGYETFWHIWDFRPKDTRLFGTFGPSLCWTGARSNFSTIPKVSHAARRTHVGPKGPHHGDGGEGRGGVGCAEGAPLRDISSLNHYISLTPIGAPAAGAHRTHKPNRNTNEEQ